MNLPAFNDPKKLADALELAKSFKKGQDGQKHGLPKRGAQRRSDESIHSTYIPRTTAYQPSPGAPPPPSQRLYGPIHDATVQNVTRSVVGRPAIGTRGMDFLARKECSKTTARVEAPQPNAHGRFDMPSSQPSWEPLEPLPSSLDELNQQRRLEKPPSNEYGVPNDHQEDNILDTFLAIMAEGLSLNKSGKEEATQETATNISVHTTAARLVKMSDCGTVARVSEKVAVDSRMSPLNTPPSSVFDSQSKSEP